MVPKLAITIAGCITVATALATLSSFDGVVTAHEAQSALLVHSDGVARLRRRVAHLQQRLRHQSNQPISNIKGQTNSCYATSESEAQAKMLARLSAEEDADFEQKLRTGEAAELQRYPVSINTALCSEGISEREQIEIAADLMKYERYKLELSRKLENIDPDNEVQRSHQIIKKHLGEKRYLDQVIKCAMRRQTKSLLPMPLALHLVGEIISLSAQQEGEANDILQELILLGPEDQTGISVLDESGHLVSVDLQSSTPRPENSLNSDERYERTVSLSAKFFALLTPEQQQRLREVEADSNLLFHLLPQLDRVPQPTPASPESTQGE